MLFTVLLPLGSAPESLMLSVTFVTEAVVQVTTRQDTRTELMRLSRGILIEHFSYLLDFSPHDYLRTSDKWGQ